MEYRKLLLAGCAPLFATAFNASIAIAVEAEHPSDRFSLVGVISSDGNQQKTRGVAVLKDKASGVTMTLKTGDFIPYEGKLHVKSVQRNQVVITDGTASTTVSYLGSQEAVEPEAPVKPLVSEEFLTRARVGLAPIPASDEDSHRRLVEPKVDYLKPTWVEDNSLRANEFETLDQLQEENFDMEDMD